jgi:PAS domain S-box-containing protein
VTPTESAFPAGDSLFRALLESTPDATVIVNRAGTIVLVNSQTERRFGYARAELLGQPADMLVPPRFRSQSAAHRNHYFAELRVGEPGAGLDLYGLRRNGEEFPVEICLSPLETEHEMFVSSSIRDVTDRKLAESTVRLQRDLTNRCLDTSEVILLALDVNGRVTLINRKGCDLLGWTEAELLGRDFLETCLPARLRSELTEKFRTVVAGDLSIVEAPIVSKSGEERLVEWRNTLLNDDAGNVIGTFSSGSDITDRSQAVEALRTAEERMRFALEAANVGIWDMDYTTGVLRWSAAIEKMYGVPAGTFGGTFEEFLERIHPDDRASLLETVGEAMKSGADFIVQNRAIWPDGTVRWLSGAGRVHLGGHGEPVRAIGISQDITERKHAEATLAQSEARKAAVLDSVLDCIVTMDANGRVTEFNAAAERTFGYTKADAIGRTLADLIIPPSLREAHTAGLARYLATGEGPLLGKLIEVTAARSDGSEIPVELTITAIRSDTAPIFTGVLRDMTARRQADETRTRLAAIVDSSDDAIFSTTLEGTIVTWNAGAERLYGYTVADAIGGRRALVVPAGESADETAAMVARAARGEAGVPFETQRVRKDGSIIDISLTISPMTDSTGRVTGVSTIARDITSRKKAEAELKRLNDEIQLQRLRVFKATIRTVQDIVNNLLNSFHLVRLESGAQLSSEMLLLIDQMIDEAAVKLKTLGDLETVKEKEMAIGLGIEYPGSS